MKAVKFNESSVTKFRNKFVKNNDAILESLKKINEEVENLSKILNTPNSSRKAKDMLEIIKENKNLVNTNKKEICEYFENALEAYREFNFETNQIVGDVDE